MRLFFALDIPVRVRRALSRVEISQRESWRWVREENLHLTLHFLGEWEDGKLPEVLALGKGVARAHSPFFLECRGLGVFPERGRPRVLWAGVQTEPALDALSQALGGSGGDHHITLARRKKQDKRPLSEPSHTSSFGCWAVTGFHLFESKLGKAGPSYTVLKSWEL